ncbi:WYL domain-containing protein [Riemerella columbipharyngis]|uniref:Uncharacterized protein n=1 Tax=Riemerella columbipharyngis TaxID=1071918 RepID=A0A1G7BKH2_9FLAO|nr:hypothetical protein [Riemerella columbipharyngis]SDE26775.1 hypothetical protein SAMN05421544_1064 [Riemerella columbipharyngis]
MYKNSFGIVAPNDYPAEEIILSFSKQQGNYVKLLPLHHSQTIIEETDSEVVISLKFVPTFDFIQEILSLLPRENISPKIL